MELDPFNPKRNERMLSSRYNSSNFFLKNIKSKNKKTIPILEKEEEGCLSKEERLKEEIQKLEQELVYLNSLESSDLKITLEKAIKKQINKETFYLHSIVVGGEEYVELNNVKPKDNIEANIEEAKEGSKKPIHIKLRQFGYINEYDLIKESQNEILGLVAEIIQIKKSSPSLNENIGGLSTNYKIIEDLNEFNENVYFVIDRNTENLEQKKIGLIKAIEDKSEEKDKISEEILNIHTAMKQRKRHNLEAKQRNQWRNLLNKYKANKLSAINEDGFLTIGISFLLQLKYSNEFIPEIDFKKKIKELNNYFDNASDNKNKISIEMINNELLKIHTNYNNKIPEIVKLIKEYEREKTKEGMYNNSIGRDIKLNKLYYKYQQLLEIAQETQADELHSLFDQLCEQNIFKKQQGFLDFFIGTTKIINLPRLNK